MYTDAEEEPNPNAVRVRLDRFDAPPPTPPSARAPCMVLFSTANQRRMWQVHMHMLSGPAAFATQLAALPRLLMAGASFL